MSTRRISGSVIQPAARKISGPFIKPKIDFITFEGFFILLKGTVKGKNERE